MAKVTEDVAFDEENDTIENVVSRIEKRFHVKARVIGPSPNGWPEVEFEGEKLDLARMLRQEFGDEDGFLANFIE